MLGVKILDKKLHKNGSGLNFDIKDILAAIVESTSNSRWRCRDLWYTTTRNGKVVSVKEARLKLSGEKLLRLAASIHQTIDGRFEARSEGAAKHPWLIIIAFDSSWFEVWSSKPRVLEKIKERFKDVSEMTA